MKLNKLTLFSVIVIVICVFINITSIVAQSSMPDINKLKIKDKTHGYSEGTIGSKNQSGPSINAVTPTGVVVTAVRCIGSGLVDLETEMTANMGITSVYGSHWYNSTAGKRTAQLYRPSNGNVPWFVELHQFKETPGTTIWTCGSSGTVVFAYTYSYPFASVPTNFLAIVF